MLGGGSWEFQDEPREKAASRRDCFFSGLLGNHSALGSFFEERVEKGRG